MSSAVTKKNISGPMLKNIQSYLNFTYLNNDEHTHLDKRTDNTDILDMTFISFISSNLTKHDIQFLMGDDLDSDHLPTEISIDAQLYRNIHSNPIRYKFNQTDRHVFESTLEAVLSSGEVPELMSTQDIDRYAYFIVTVISTAAILTSKNGRPESQPVSEESLWLIKEKRKLRRQYSQAHDPLIKTRINQLQKEIKNNLRIESQASWEKFCNDISLETNRTEPWRKIKNFLKPKGQRDYPTLRLDAKTAKTNADKAQLFAESVERHFGIQSDNFDSTHFDEVNQFIEDNYEYFYHPEDSDDYRSDGG